MPITLDPAAVVVSTISGRPTVATGTSLDIQPASGKAGIISVGISNPEGQVDVYIYSTLGQDYVSHYVSNVGREVVPPIVATSGFYVRVTNNSGANIAVSYVGVLWQTG